jgi:hypothetical protein
MLERVLGASTDPAVLCQEHPQPTGREVHARLLLQICREARGGPDVEHQAQGRRRRLQRGFHGCQIGGICLHGPPRARRIDQRRHPTRREARQPVGHGFDRAPTPARDARHLIAQRHRFDHLQPLAYPPPQIGALQLPLHLCALLWGDRHVQLTHPLAPLLLPRAPTAEGRHVVYSLFRRTYPQILSLDYSRGCLNKQSLLVMVELVNRLTSTRRLSHARFSHICTGRDV